jgi:hypothetical protein
MAVAVEEHQRRADIALAVACPHEHNFEGGSNRVPWATESPMMAAGFASFGMVSRRCCGRYHALEPRMHGTRRAGQLALLDETTC